MAHYGKKSKKSEFADVKVKPSSLSVGRIEATESGNAVIQRYKYKKSMEWNGDGSDREKEINVDKIRYRGLLRIYLNKYFL